MTLSGIFIVLMGVYCIYLKQNKSPLSKSLFNLHLGAIVSTVLYNISLITTNLLSAYFITSLYYISIHFLVILLTDFIFIFTEMSSSPKYKKFINKKNSIEELKNKLKEIKIIVDNEKRRV